MPIRTGASNGYADRGAGPLKEEAVLKEFRAAAVKEVSHANRPRPTRSLAWSRTGQRYGLDANANGRPWPEKRWPSDLIWNWQKWRFPRFCSKASSIVIVGCPFRWAILLARPVRRGSSRVDGSPIRDTTQSAFL